MRRKTTTLGALAVTLGLPLLTAPPASASGNCTDSQDHSFSTPGYNTDLSVYVCSTEGTSRHHGGYIIVYWHDGGDSATDGDRKFDALRIHGRIERYDDTRDSDSWSIAGLVNRNESGQWVSPTMEVTSTQRGGWTADGKVTFDIDRDGEGTQPAWQLHGSPAKY
jgi:hypothetical protein